jgi:hypothetical protein
MYSSPYLRVMFKVSSRRRLLRYVLPFVDVGVFFEWSDSGRGVFSLLVCPNCDSVDLRRLTVGGGT